MNTKKIIYVEMTPDEGKIFYNGNEYTDYICVLETAIDSLEWEEVDNPEENFEENV